LRAAPPNVVDETVAGHHLLGVQEEDGEQGALLRAPERKLTAVVPRRY
jgi:hypothetical protein